MDSVLILNSHISVTSTDEVAHELASNRNMTVAICNVNTVVQCFKDKDLNARVDSFDIRCPDGFPIAKASSILYKNNQKRVDGYNIFKETLKKGLDSNLSHYFFGNTEHVTKKMISNLKNEFPSINIKGYYCPPILTIDNLINDKYFEEIKKLSPDIVWVSLGFPKQEEFIYILNKKNIGHFNLIGIGAVFEWVAETKIKAPELVANLGLEWIFRLLQEPRRLFKRYLVDNFLFIIYFIKQYIKN